jgi:SM-20-related protein
VISSGAQHQIISGDHEDQILTGLAENRWVAVPGFLAPSVCDELVQWMTLRRQQGAFHRAGIGKGEAFRLDDGIRSDTVCWLEQGRQDLTDPERLLLAKIESLRERLNQALYLGLRDFEGHLTVYPVGGHYARHVDRFSSSGARTVSLVLYLNRNWSHADGGLLRIFAPGKDDRILAEVLPEAGTLAMFMSDDMPHEVTVSARERFSVTGWFRNSLASLF